MMYIQLETPFQCFTNARDIKVKHQTTYIILHYPLSTFLLKRYSNSYLRGSRKAIICQTSHLARYCNLSTLGPPDLGWFFCAPIFLPTLGFSPSFFNQYLYKGTNFSHLKISIHWIRVSMLKTTSVMWA